MTTNEQQSGSVVRPFHVEFPDEAFVGTTAGFPTSRRHEVGSEHSGEWRAGRGDSPRCGGFRPWRHPP